MEHTATYSPEDNKIRVYPACRLDKDEYNRLKTAGYKWAPKQELFVAPMWTPEREDIAIELCGEIGDEDTSLAERAEERAERFEDYSEKRLQDAESAKKTVSAIADNIPLGQPILIGHHSEKHARKDAERIENGMRKAVRMWEQSKYWTQRAAGALHNAKYKESPAVRARRIKGLEADKRKQEKTKTEAERLLNSWSRSNLTLDMAKSISNCDYASFCFTLAEYPRELPKSQYEGMMGLWSALDYGIIDEKQAAALAIPSKQRIIENCTRWIAHLENRLLYERAMMQESGGTVSDKKGPEKGGACKCWASPRDGWSYIQKVNRVSVTVLDRFRDDARFFRRNIPFDKLAKIMTAAEVQAARDTGFLVEIGEHGFILRNDNDLLNQRQATVAAINEEPERTDFDNMKDALRNGIKIVSAPQLFPTPKEIAKKMIEYAGQMAGCRILEPSAGTGNLIHAIVDNATGFDCCKIVAVEKNLALAENLREMRNKYVHANDENFKILCSDFLECSGDLGLFDKVIMNPPFENGADIKHINHALNFLKPGGRLIALCVNGPRQRDALMLTATHWENLPADSFKNAGTRVNVALLAIDK